MSRIRYGFPVAAWFVLTFILSACQPTSQAAIQITDAWGRPSPMEANLGAFYMKIHNRSDQDDQLLSASSPACGAIELHESVMEGDMMQMRPVEGIPIPAGETVELKTGGLHLMCIEKQQDFAVGAKIPLTLNFQNAGEVKLEVEVKNP